MKFPFLRSCIAPVALASLLATSCSSPAPQPVKESVSKADDLSFAEETKTALHKFDENKFGMFIHWGLYAIPAGEWNGKYVRGIGEWIMNRAKIPVKDYEKLAAKFNPTKFNANEWSQLAKDAGVRYMVITSKHHDGFAMYGSKVSKYNIVDATPFHRDPMKELSAACAERNIGFGFYYSQDQDWHEPNGRGNTWDFPADRNAQQYLQSKVFPQVKEILTNYGKLSLIWFDTPGMLSAQQVSDLRKEVKTLQPTCLLNSRIGHDKGDYFQTGDNAIPIQVYSKMKWEVPATLNDTWGFKKNDTHWKDPADLIAKLADIASKGGNYLLNVGPTAEGVIPEASQRILKTIGKWLDVNGESIYGTTASPFYLPDITWRATVKPGKVYLHLINWPGRTLTFNGLQSDVKRAYFLANNKDVKCKRDGDTLAFTLPAKPVDPYDSVLVLDIADQQPKVASQYAYNALPAKLDLYSWTARLQGEELRYDKKSETVSGFRKVETEKNQLQWYPYESLSGTYGVDIEYSATKATSGSPFQVQVQRGRNAGDTLNGVVENTSGKLVSKHLDGSIHVAPEDQQIRFSLPDDDKSAAMRIRKITLTKQ